METKQKEVQSILSRLKSDNKLAILDIGSSIRRRGTITIDKVPLEGVDIVCDILNGIPFPNNSIDGCIMFHVIEHLPVNYFEFIFNEIWRISKNGAMLHIRTPHFSCGYQCWSDPTHVRPFGLRTFRDYLCSGERMHFNSQFTHIPPFEPVSVELHYYGFRENRPVRLKLFSEVIDKIVNSHIWVQRQFERRLAYLFGGFEEIEAKLKVLK
jgi:SAM-dependent methyltransferase